MRLTGCEGRNSVLDHFEKQLHGSRPIYVKRGHFYDDVISWAVKFTKLHVKESWALGGQFIISESNHGVKVSLREPGNKYTITPSSITNDRSKRKVMGQGFYVRLFVTKKRSCFQIMHVKLTSPVDVVTSPQSLVIIANWTKREMQCSYAFQSKLQFKIGCHE